MNIVDLEFDTRQDEVVLIHQGAMVGLVMPSGNRALPVMATVRWPDGDSETQLFSTDEQAQKWALGTYLRRTTREVKIGAGG